MRRLSGYLYLHIISPTIDESSQVSFCIHYALYSINQNEFNTSNQNKTTTKLSKKDNGVIIFINEFFFQLKIETVYNSIYRQILSSIAKWEKMCAE